MKNKTNLQSELDLPSETYPWLVGLEGFVGSASFLFGIGSLIFELPKETAEMYNMYKLIYSGMAIGGAAFILDSIRRYKNMFSLFKQYKTEIRKNSSMENILKQS